jgi:hypothetical protein
MEAHVEPWQRQQGESGKAFAAFQMYRDMGADRSLARVGQQSGKHVSLLERWSVRWRWFDRAAAWDLHIDTERWQANEREAREMGERHARAAVAMQARALQRLQSLDPGHMGARELTYMWETGVKIERLSRGLPSERIELVGLLVRPLVQQFSAIFLEINDIEDAQVRMEQFAARADVVLENVTAGFLQAGGFAS